MDDEAIRAFFVRLKARQEEIDKFIAWRRAKFDIEIDLSYVEAEMEGKPIILDAEGAPAHAPVLKPSGISPEVQDILSELPEEIRDTLPEEDLKRLTPATARELVTSLTASFSGTKKKPVKTKTVKVRKVKKVPKKAGRTREDLLALIPEEVKASLPEDTLDGLTLEELEAVVASSADSLPAKEEKEEEMDSDDPLSIFSKKYGREKAEILVTIPENLLEGIPEDQIHEMDIDTLKGLAEALEPRD
jgi:hypothetical protein